jgi:DNA repair exonuclease SbcCD ATPase subunit
MNEAMPPVASEATAVFALLNVLADPAAAKERLETLGRAKAEAEQAHAKMIEAIAENQALVDEAKAHQAAASDAYAKVAAQQAQLQTQSKDLDDKSKALDVRMHSIQDREDRLSKREDALVAQDAAHRQAAAELVIRERDVAGKEQRLHAAEAAHSARVTQLRSIVNG